MSYSLRHQYVNVELLGYKSFRDEGNKYEQGRREVDCDIMDALTRDDIDSRSKQRSERLIDTLLKVHSNQAVTMP